VVFGSQRAHAYWSAVEAQGWATSFRIILSDSGGTWIAEATKGGKAVEGRATSPEAAWRSAYRQVVGEALGQTDPVVSAAH
jgi:hypothetical protein